MLTMSMMTDHIIKHVLVEAAYLMKHYPYGYG